MEWKSDPKIFSKNVNSKIIKIDKNWDRQESFWQLIIIDILNINLSSSDIWSEILYSTLGLSLISQLFF